CQQDNSIPITF
nr:immunoglobulin light chain junction region [Macaca mulatta]